MTLAAKLAADQTVFTGWSSLPDALAVEAFAATAFETITLDMQHGGHSEDSVLRTVPIVMRAGKPAIVRIPVGRFDMASRALDFGAEAVIAPMVNSADDARDFAAAMKYPPLGERSWGPTFAMPRTGNASMAEWLGSSNAATLAFAMIETRRAYEALDEILAVDGIDGVFVGPSDFSLTWTGGRVVDPALEEMMEAVGDIAARARAAGRHAAIYVVDPANAGRFVTMGYRLLAIGGESRFMALGAQAQIERARESFS